MKTFTSICVFAIAVLATVNAPGASRNASISGTQQPTVSLSPTQLAFREYPRCEYAFPETVTLTNNGPGVLDISRIAINHGNFSQTHTCGSTLGVGNSCTITVTWGGGGNQSASLLITDNGVGSPQSVGLLGRWVCLK